MSPTKRVKKKQVTKVVRRNRTSYSVEQKKAVVSYTREYRRNKVAKNFNLDSSMAERRLYTWVLEQRKQALAITYITLQYKISEILQQPDMTLLYSDLAENFKASYH
ncbi:42938_t:CDS:2 [Gigaspora margarita]|uniref:42938_t:CDS:1 n=1 Tax=Gigaspora margarita TaxID=4874 RepID=A0ABM8VX12_GIGMA|nr:42938_t:CDS:2 [Gigaspora margarita]